MSFCVGTLTTETGWEIKSPENAAGLHFYYWFVARNSQSKLIDSVPSFYYLWKQYGENRDELVAMASQTLQQYMRELFPDATAECSYENVNGTTTQYHLRANVKFSHLGIRYDLGKVVEVNPGNFNLLENKRLS